MGFSDDVEQVRVERSEQAFRANDAAQAFRVELEVSWRDVLEYWSMETARFTADEVGWILHGSRYVPVGGTELVPLPVFPMQVARAPRPRMDHDLRTTPRGVSVPAFMVLEGIALCEPGQLRPITPRVQIDMSREHAERELRTGGYFDVSVDELPIPSPFPEATHQIAFAEYSAGRFVVFGHTGEATIDVLSTEPSSSGSMSWTSEGTLRYLLASALADAIDKRV